MKYLVNILVVMAATIAGGCVVALVEFLGVLANPMPEGLDRSDYDAMAEWVRGLPTTAFLIVLLAWGAGPFTAGYIARRFSVGRSVLVSLIPVALLLLGTVMNLVSIPHPWWMFPAGVLVCIVFGLLGSALGGPKHLVVATERMIEAPAGRVFSVLSSVEEFKNAVPGIQSVEFLSEQTSGTGTRFRETRIMNGREASTILEVGQFVEDDRIQMVSLAGGTEWDTLFTVSSEGGPTRMTMCMKARPLNLLSALMVPLILPMVSKAVEGDMDAVKTYCEA